MMHIHRVALWDAINRVVAASGGSVSNASVARQRAVVETESVIADIEAATRDSGPPWLSDAAEALGEVRPEDGAPLALNWTQVIDAIHELREDRDHWKKRAEQWVCPCCGHNEATVVAAAPEPREMN